MILDATNKKLQLALDSTPSLALPWVSSWVDILGSVPTPGAADGSISDTNAADVVPAPASSTQRKLLYLSLCNVSAAPRVVTIQYVSGTNTRVIAPVTLSVGYTLYYDDRDGWYVCDASGVRQTGLLGPQGLQGVQGIRGPTGPTGPTGPAVGVSGPVELNFGTTPVYSATFIVTDANVTPSSKIFCCQDGEAATGRQADENEMDPITYSCFPGTGQFTVNANTNPRNGPVCGLYRMFYILG